MNRASTRILRACALMGDKYRVTSRVSTGPSSSPNIRGVCIGARFANIENVLQRSCTDPAQ